MSIKIIDKIKFLTEKGNIISTDGKYIYTNDNLIHEITSFDDDEKIVYFGKSNAAKIAKNYEAVKTFFNCKKRGANLAISVDGKSESLFKKGFGAVFTIQIVENFDESAIENCKDKNYYEAAYKYS